MTEAYTQAVAVQRLAANPGKSVFVSANAGSGKTRVLVDRVSRLLLDGAEPDKILALTYTKAAAAEMQSRLFDALGKWSIMGTADLNAKLNQLQERSGKRSRAEIGRARQLFAKALETPGGLKVQTIHAFCEKLLRQFPLEAGLAPGLESIDEQDAKSLQAQVIEAIELDIVQNPSTQLAKSFRLLASETGSKKIDEIYAFAMGAPDKAAAWSENGGVRSLADYFDIDENSDADTIKSKAWEAAPKAILKAAMTEMYQSTKTDQKSAAVLDAALIEPDAVKAFDLYMQIFLTKAGSPRASIVGVNCGEAALDVFGSKNTGYGDEAMRMIEVQDQLKALHALSLTRAAFELSQRTAADYSAMKARRRVIDFADQINKARTLLQDSTTRDWVRYKLDGGVDHILVDEAQDTSAKQWDIVNALAGEFFQPSPDQDPRKKRTLFAVGDEKQSIYSFQGAEPELFLAEIQALSLKQVETPQVNMNMSFRSAPQILELVDEVFYEQEGILETFDPEIVIPGSDKGQHIARRNDLGLVEFWPASPMPEKTEAENPSDPRPVDVPDQSSSREKLASEIALQIKTWLDNREPVNVREGEDGAVITRPMQPADIIILVKGRLPFFDALIRHLKMKGVPVAGADRLKLTDSIAVQDLLSLAKFALNPYDDLSLAEVLKSPIVGWNDHQLEDVAYGRDGTLWATLPDGPERTLLKRIRKVSRNHAPYEFFARTLAMVPEGTQQSIKARMLARLGGEILDALDAFLAKALEHQRRGAPSLMAFVRAITLSEDKVKRELDGGAGEVRVMTVYGAKGLEAPVVILPDTTSAPDTSRETMLPHADGFAFKLNKADQPEAMASLEQQRLAEKMREDMRLLYVALTRAESRLLICGYQNRGKVSDGSWHARLERAMHGLSASSIDTVFGPGLRYGAQPEPKAARAETRDDAPELPDWAYVPVASVDKSPRHKRPSKLTAPDEDRDMNAPVRSPLLIGAAGPDRYARGNHIHKLLELLPDIDRTERRAALRRYLAGQAVNADLANDIEATVFATLDAPAFLPIFGPGSRPEVTLAGTIETSHGPLRLSGQIDRLCVQDDTVLIIDYKSNRPPPSSPEDVDVLYVRQMAAYKALVRSLYPGKAVRTLLLWTDGPHMMELPDIMLDTVDWHLLAQ